ncbi:helix-turn-helix domain-containing protein, partial [Mesorhizobium sp. M0276]|uniref:helix-turn-helix domain-containing protein n=1 Tax=Mesorhizobium sp. M0276 TaxID=2956928 RepID=UPI00333AD58B
RRRARNRGDRLLALLDAIHDAAVAGLKEHDRLVLAKSQMERRLRERRASSKLPDLVELVLSRPLVSTGMIQERLKVTKQGALNLVGELGLREMTGRGRFRAWGIV